MKSVVLRLRWLTVHRYRDVVPGTTLEFHDSINVLLGKNGSGKTTLLELVSAILRFDFTPLAGEVFDIEFAMEHAAPPVLPCQLRARVTGHVEDTLAAVLRPSAHGRQEARVTFSVAGHDRYIVIKKDNRVRVERQEQVVHEQAGAPVVALDELSEVLPHAVEGTGMDSSIAALLWALLWNGVQTRRFDEALLTFDELTGSDHKHRYPSHIWLPAFPDPHGGYPRFAPEYVWVAATSKLQRDPSASTLAFEHHELPFLERTARLCGYQSARMELSLLGRVGAQAVERSLFGNARFLFTRKHGRATITHQHLSYGQKRLLALLFYLDANPDLVVADELVNGMHHEWLEDIMPDIAGRQAFLSSQNPLLLDYLEFDSAEHVAHSFVLCSVDDDDRMTWRNMTEDEAQAFYDAYEAGIQHVSEILRSKGLW